MVSIKTLSTHSNKMEQEDMNDLFLYMSKRKYEEGNQNSFQKLGNGNLYYTKDGSRKQVVTRDIFS